IRSRDGAVTSTLTKQAPQSSQCHRASASSSLQNDEERSGRAVGRSLPSHVVSDGSSNHIREREDTVALAFAVNAKLAVFDEHVAYLQLQHFGRAHSTQQHQVNDCEVAVATKAAEELEDFRTRERLDDAPRDLDSKRNPTMSWQLMQTEEAVLAAPSI